MITETMITNSVITVSIIVGTLMLVLLYQIYKGDKESKSDS